MIGRSLFHLKQKCILDQTVGFSAGERQVAAQPAVSVFNTALSPRTMRIAKVAIRRQTFVGEDLGPAVESDGSAGRQWKRRHGGGDALDDRRRTAIVIGRQNGIALLARLAAHAGATGSGAAVRRHAKIPPIRSNGL